LSLVSMMISYAKRPLTKKTPPELRRIQGKGKKKPHHGRL